MMNLDKILDNTKINNISKNEIIRKTKEFHNNLFDEQYDIFKNNITTTNISNNYILIKDFNILKINMMIGYVNIQDPYLFCEGRILDLKIIDKNINLVIYNFIINKIENIESNNYNFYSYNKYSKVGGELHKYSFVENLLLLEKGQFIKYINNKKRNKVSCAGRIENIKYSKDRTGVIAIELYNFMINKKWKIKTEKYYIFVYDCIEKQIYNMEKKEKYYLNFLN